MKKKRFFSIPILLFILASCVHEHESSPAEELANTASKNVSKVESSDSIQNSHEMPPPRLIPAFDSEKDTRDISDMDELSREFLMGIISRDGERIKNLVVTREFYLNFLWPEFEKGIHESSRNGEFHWEMLRMKSMGGMLDKFDTYGWEHLEYQGTYFDGIDHYRGFKLHNKPLVEVKDKTTGKTLMIEVFGSVVELDNGTLKILSIPG